MKVLIIDNYDSFTFNLYQHIGEMLLLKGDSKLLKTNLKVSRNNEISLLEIEKYNPTHIILSPGPGSPDDKRYFGVCGDIIRNLGGTASILGVCLGMQGIAYCFGGKVIKAKIPMHGKTSKVTHNNHGVFKRLPQNIEVMRYHSLVVDKETIPDCLEITAKVVSSESEDNASDQDVVMGIKHTEYDIEGIQFHPESFASEGSRDIFRNYLFKNSENITGTESLTTT